jgi:hypothetical protein
MVSRRLGPATAAAALTAAVFATRWPWRSEMLFSWDSANFALAVAHIDIAAHQPHPPGYLAYVFAGRAFAAVTGDVNRALVLWNVMASVAVVALVTIFGRAVDRSQTGRYVGLAAGAIVMTSPLFWFYGEVAEIYVSELLVALTLTALAWAAQQGRRGAAAVCGAMVGVAALVKVTAVMFSAPLMAVVWIGLEPRARRQFAAAMLASVGAAAAVFLSVAPEVVSITWAQFTEATSGSSVLTGGDAGRALNRNLRELGGAVISALGVVNLAAFAIWTAKDRTLPPGLNARFVLFWAAPLLLFLGLVHIGRPGYVLPLLPLAALILAGFYVRLGPRVAAALVTLQGGVNAAHFLLLAPFPAGVTGAEQAYAAKAWHQRLASDLQPLTVTTARSIAQSDDQIGELRQIVASTCPTGEALIVSLRGAVDVRRISWYFPAATALGLESGRTPVLVERREVRPIAAEGMALSTSCPLVWLAGNNPSSVSAAIPPPGSMPTSLGWTSPPMTLHLDRRGLTSF